ncbi:hypothetical protein DICPUDRAFT_35373 [Dictyostelium purpureum]|uniref:Phosphatidylinositol 3-kinase n=1 Tax=Dictyostelium purpureum TaxID=5786 RepID=F0ZP96_DICPU|nr:uncharacterized protein DICPUDRAFT_35373 [Dictyostelium purpureum]EGC34226.1 hypothetical protein DICPUDRAFT_35373 [Dictyostelium purpureum]|eukprot:XP_003289236.1 hypothetical protein DICPUDRAFT_35373 [Dictyostelium purpureum]
MEKNNALAKSKETDAKILKLYNVVKIDKLKRKQEFEACTNQFSKNLSTIRNLEKEILKEENLYSDEIENCKKEINLENEIFINRQKEFIEINKVNININTTPINNTLQIRKLRELHNNCLILENNINEISSINNSKINHLNDLIKSVELKIENHNKIFEEKERLRKNKLDLDLLLDDLEKSKNSISNSNILNSIHISNLTSSLENSIKLLKEDEYDSLSKKLKDDDENQLKKENEEKEKRKITLPKAPSFDMNNLHKKIVVPTTPANVVPENDFNKKLLEFKLKKQQIKQEEENKQNKLKQQHDENIQKQTENSIQYPINVFINGKLHQLLYSLELDTISSLLSKIFDYLQLNDYTNLKKLNISTIEEMSLKTSSNFYFSNKTKQYLKYVPFFIDQKQKQTFDIYVVPKKEEEEFYNKISVILNKDFETSVKNDDKEESTNFRNRMVKFLDIVNIHKLQLDNEATFISSPNSSPTNSCTNSPTNSFGQLPYFSPQTSANKLPTLIGYNRPPSTSLNSSTNSFGDFYLGSPPSASILSSSPVTIQNNYYGNKITNSNSSSSGSLHKSTLLKNSTSSIPISIQNNNNINDSNNGLNSESFSSYSPSSNSWKACSPSSNMRKFETNANFFSSSPSLSNSSGSLFTKQKSINSNLNTLYSLAQCTIRLFITENIIKTFYCNVTTTIGELQDIIFRKFSKIIENETKIMDPSKFVIKIRGLEIYLVNSGSQLCSIDFINTKSRRQKKIDLLLLERNSVDESELQASMETTCHSTLSSSQYISLNESLEKSILLEDEDLVTTPQISSNNTNKNFKIRIGGLKNFDIDEIRSSLNLNFKTAETKIYTRAQIYQGGYKIGNTMITNKIPIQNNPSWLHWLEGVSFKEIPSNAIITLMIYIKTKKERTGSNYDISDSDLLLGWVNFHIWDYKNKINSGFNSLKLWLNNTIDYSNLHQNYLDNVALTFEIESSGIQFSPEPLSNERIEQLEQYYQQQVPDTSILQTVNQILDRDRLCDLKPDEAQLIWKYRNHCKMNKPTTSISKLTLSVPWNNPEAVQEFYWLVNNWPSLDPIDSLELLSSQFLDREVRKLAILNLRRMSDSEIDMYLPQLIQALKHEPHHYSILSKFLIRRVLLNKQNMSHKFFWQIKAEILVLEEANNNNNKIYPEWLERYQLLLETFLRGTSNNKLNDIYKQYEFYSKIKSVALEIKTIASSKRRDYLNSTLSTLEISNDFKTPSNPEFRGKSIIPSGCKVKESKTLPLFLSIENYDPLGDNHYILFKAGDDLRQDQLTIQMINIMDRMWLNSGLDLQTITYQCIASGPMEGMIEIVGDSKTIADIQKQAGGITAALSETAISDWLKQENPSELEYNSAVENFIRSTAACSVYSYILGLGDRHNDNIMITRSGHLFHIDFGRFLGNVQTFKGFKRERAPFVFPASFAYVVGDEHFKSFEDLCAKAYNVIRRKANVFLNLFLMMVSTGLPELNKISDIYYLRDALALELTEELAAQKFKQMIQESIASKSTDLNFMVHIAFNPN